MLRGYFFQKNKNRLVREDVCLIRYPLVESFLQTWYDYRVKKLNIPVWVYELFQNRVIIYIGIDILIPCIFQVK